MSLKTIITSLVLGSSTLASAQPLSARFDASWSSGPSMRDHRHNNRVESEPRNIRYDDSYSYQRPAQRSWMSLGSFNQEMLRGAVVFQVPQQLGTVNQIMIEGTASKTRLLEVRVNYADGRSQVVQTDTYIGERGTVSTIPFTPNFVVNVAPGRILSVTVTAMKPASSTFSVLAI